MTGTMVLLLQQTTDTPIRPKDIDADGAGAFPEKAMDDAAFRIIHYCQSRRTWAPFKLSQLTRYMLALWPSWYDDDLEDGLNRLVSQRLIQRDDKDQMTLTVAFVASCYKASPVQGLPRKKSKKRSRKAPAVSKFQLMSEDPFRT